MAATLPKRIAGKVGIGHTRWATHGPATDANAHPHTSEDGRICVVHNGIIDNADALRQSLMRSGVQFTSDTDTEVLAHLIARSSAGTLEGAVADAVSRITGTYAIAVTDSAHPDRLVAARNGSPLIIGVGDREMFVASDLDDEPAIADHAKVLAAATSLFFIGRVRGFPVAREGAQKFKEISYRHAEAYQTSELKHGPLALIDESLPTVAILPHDDLQDRNLAAVAQIKARGGAVLTITHADVQFGDLDVPRIGVPRSEPELDPILLTVPLQLLAYHAALTLGHDIDKPRNLAKSVTVE